MVLDNFDGTLMINTLMKNAFPFFVIAHGKASFLKQEKIAKLLREGGGLASAPTPASNALP